MKLIDELEAAAKAVPRQGKWCEGIAGNANVVAFNGEYIVAVCQASTGTKRKFISLCDPETILALVDVVRAAEVVDAFSLNTDLREALKRMENLS